MKKTINYTLRNPKNPFKKYILNKFKKDIYSIISQLNVNNILDVGCGEGFELRYMEKKGFLSNKNFLGIDISLVAINIAKQEFPELKFQIGNIYKLDVESKSFDLVIAIEVIEHLDNFVTALKELIRVSNKYILISIPNQPFFSIANLTQFKYISNLGDFPGHKNRWLKGDFTKILREYLDILSIKTSTVWNIFLCKVRCEKKVK